MLEQKLAALTKESNELRKELENSKWVENEVVLYAETLLSRHLELMKANIGLLTDVAELVMNWEDFANYLPEVHAKWDKDVAGLESE